MIEIPDDEVTFRASRSGGPGGQNVNKVESRVTISFDFHLSRTLTEAQKERLAHSLLVASKLDSSGCIVITSQEHRTQLLNRRAAMGKLHDLIRTALAPRKKRKQTKPSKASKARRRDAKTKRSELKKGRGRVQ